MARCAVCSEKIGISSRGLSRRASMYLAVVAALEGLAWQLDDVVGDEEDALVSRELDDELLVSQVQLKLMELGGECRAASEAVHTAAHRQGGTLNFDALRDLQEQCRMAITLAHFACEERDVRPNHDMPSFVP